MFSSEEYIDDINKIPTQWILQNYLKLPYTLTGQTVKIKSLFNPKDRDPSMVFYWWQDRYVFKDFSSGNKGSVIHAMMALFNKDFKETADIIIKDYLRFKSQGNVEAKINLNIVAHHWQAKEVKTRQWNTDDAKYWMSFGIGSALLQKYNVKPLQSYEIERVESDTLLVIDSYKNNVPKYVYGYFREDGSLYKIYRPFWKNKKFFTLDSNYIQGTEQVSNKKFCIIAASMKDLLALKALGVTADIISPNSENTLLPESTINKLMEDYEAVVTLLDPDDAGIKAMQEYEAKYGLPFVYIHNRDNYDVADLVKKKGKEEALMVIIPKLNQKIDSTILINEEIKDVVS